MSQWWASWYVPEGLMPQFELHSPWWITGETFEEPPRLTVVAALRAEDEARARQQFLLAFDEPPEGLEERFIEPFDGSPYSGRFPRADWMEW